MSFQVNIPPSVVAKMAKTEEVNEKQTEEEVPVAGKKREDWKKLKELEEARKAGTAPAMKDEEGKDINPHIPQYIMQAPWYFGATQPTLKHQREPDEWKKEHAKLDEWYKKGVIEGSAATKYRKGACENCGAMTHKKKDCLERPRKLGAKFTGEDIAPDEYIQSNLEFDFDGKRDRWNGYDPSSYKHVVDDYQKLEEAKRQLKAQKIENALLEGSLDESVAKEITAEDNDDDKYADDMAMPGQKFETKQRITVRNLRIREDTAKYLLNLDLNSAHYDPKTRAMRENPFEGKGVDPGDLPFAGDNFVRWSGDAQEISKRQLFAWEAYEKGTDAHLQADPTKLELLSREFNKRKETHVATKKESILSKYGGEEHLQAPPKQLLLAQTEEYVEYSRHGTLLKGQEKARVKSRYEEDVYINNHTTVWGSYWRDGRWGYRCCHSYLRESYCLGQAGKT
jgi:pre-mRNA-processing factor SLU7